VRPLASIKGRRGGQTQLNLAPLLSSLASSCSAANPERRPLLLDLSFPALSLSLSYSRAHTTTVASGRTSARSELRPPSWKSAKGTHLLATRRRKLLARAGQTASLQISEPTNWGLARFRRAHAAEQLDVRLERLEGRRQQASHLHSPQQTKTQAATPHLSATKLATPRPQTKRAALEQSCCRSAKEQKRDLHWTGPLCGSPAIDWRRPNQGRRAGQPGARASSGCVQVLSGPQAQRRDAAKTSRVERRGELLAPFRRQHNGGRRSSQWAPSG